MKLAAAHLQRVLKRLLGHLYGVFIFVGDILVGSNGRTEDHAKLLDEILKLRESVILQLSWDKSEFFKQSLPYLGRNRHVTGSTSSGCGFGNDAA